MTSTITGHNRLQRRRQGPEGASIQIAGRQGVRGLTRTRLLAIGQRGNAPRRFPKICVRTRNSPTKPHRGSTRSVAALLGVSQRTVERWVTKKPGARRPPGPMQVRAIEEAVLARWQPRVRARRRVQAEAEGFVFRTRARFGFAAPAGSSDDPRVRWINQDLPEEVARELFAARDAGAGEQQQTVILTHALGHAYFREWGRRAHALHIAFSDIEFADFSIG
ncbi:telomere-protecting terminal protein Tpg [Streptomyces achromogenes]|uniref:telomere-protecting terminal protein Tpg n=1 Tax=Streptomyces achromogenes TaxID=67255 RepID=UPI0036FD0F3C